MTTREKQYLVSDPGLMDACHVRDVHAEVHDGRRAHSLAYWLKILKGAILQAISIYYLSVTLHTPTVSALNTKSANVSEGAISLKRD